MRFLFVSDLHGNKLLYSSLEGLMISVKPDALIIGGDLFAYSPYSKPQIEFIEGYFCGFLERIGTPVYIIPGNCDRSLSINYLKQMNDSKSLHFLTLDGTMINGIEFIGYSCIPPSPFKIKDWERRDLKEDSIVLEDPCLLSNENNELELVSPDFLNSLPSIEEDLCILNNKKAIWVIHSPPFGGILDRNYDNICCGSKAVRKAIERVQPILTLHGHIHEAPRMSHMWSERIGETTSINPGSSEMLQAVIFEIDKSGGIVSINHTVYSPHIQHQVKNQRE